MVKRYKKICGISVMMAFLLLVSMAYSVEVKADPKPTGQCGEKAYWTYDASSKTMTFTGEGKIDGLGEGPYLWQENCSYKPEKIVVGTGITELGDDVFNSTVGWFAKKVTIADSVTQIGNGAFVTCDRLEEVKLPAKLDLIDRNTFSECKKLKKIVIPNGVKRIAESAFVSCTALTEVYLPEKLVELDSRSFANCTSLAKVYIPKATVKFNDHDTDPRWEEDNAPIFMNCPKVRIYGYKGSKAQTYAKSHKIPFTAITSPGLKVKKATATLKVKNLKKKNLTFKIVSTSKAGLTYKKLSGNKKIAVASNGKVTVKKGLKKGTYKIKVSITTKKNMKYKTMTKKATVTIKIK